MGHEREISGGAVAVPPAARHQHVMGSTCSMGSVGAARSRWFGVSRSYARRATVGVLAVAVLLPVPAAREAAAVTKTADEAGPPVLTVRQDASPEGDAPDSATRTAPRTASDPAIGTPLPSWLVTPAGALFSVRLATRDGGLPALRVAEIGATGVARLRGLVHDAGVDEHATAPPVAETALVDVQYRHPTGRLVATVVPAADDGVAALLRALDAPASLGAARPSARYAPSRLRLHGVVGTPPRGGVTAQWPVRATTLASTERCVAVRGADATRLRTELARVAKLAPTAVAVGGDGVATVWMRSGRRTMLLSVRVLLPGEPSCPALAR